MKIALKRDDYYQSIELMEAVGDNYSDNVICDVNDEWYEANKDKLPPKFEVIEDGNDLIIKNAVK
tara:strand:- start:1876 stop:2070 length:195 start_codon:yes stop_codon:yes gene_type:complete